MRTKDQIQELFDAMRSDMGVMAEHNDNEQSLLDELLTCDNEIFETYKNTFLAEV